MYILHKQGVFDSTQVTFRYANSSKGATNTCSKFSLFRDTDQLTNVRYIVYYGPFYINMCELTADNRLSLGIPKHERSRTVLSRFGTA